MLGYEGFAATCEKPLSISWRTETISPVHGIQPKNLPLNRVLHNDSGPAIEYRDGWKIWCINNVQLDEQIVMRPETQTIEQINGEQNAEIKRIRLNRYGWHRYLKEINAKVVHHRRNDIEQTEEALMRCGEMQVLVAACPSTGKIFSLEVPPTVETCEQAQHWLRGERSGFLIGAS